jgi:uncharacterized membrane protein YozB (DUF420 family)
MVLKETAHNFEMKSILTITALIEGVTGLALAIMPSLVATILLGTSVTDASAILIARLAGTALITIAVACWLSRSNTQSAVMVKAMLVYNVFSIVLLAYAVLAEGISGPGLWPAVLLHLGLLIWCLAALTRRVK